MKVVYNMSDGTTLEYEMATMQTDPRFTGETSGFGGYGGQEVDFSDPMGIYYNNPFNLNIVNVYPNSRPSSHPGQQCQIRAFEDTLVLSDITAFSSAANVVSVYTPMVFDSDVDFTVTPFDDLKQFAIDKNVGSTAFNVPRYTLGTLQTSVGATEYFKADGTSAPIVDDGNYQIRTLVQDDTGNVGVGELGIGSEINVDTEEKAYPPEGIASYDQWIADPSNPTDYTYGSWTTTFESEAYRVYTDTYYMSTYTPALLFDSTHTRNVYLGWVADMNLGTPPIAGIELPYNLRMTKYSFTMRHNYTTQFPRTWVTEGSNDGINWVQIDSQNNNFSTVNETKEFIVTTDIAYKMYRWKILTNGGHQFMAIETIRLYGYKHATHVLGPALTTDSILRTHITSTSLDKSYTFSDTEQVYPPAGIASAPSWTAPQPRRILHDHPFEWKLHGRRIQSMGLLRLTILLHGHLAMHSTTRMIMDGVRHFRFLIATRSLIV